MALLGPREMSDLSPQRGPKRTMIRVAVTNRDFMRTRPRLVSVDAAFDGLCPTQRSHLAINECSAYISDMFRQDPKRARHRQRQARYEARQRAGLRLYPAPPGSAEIGALVALG
jgi:hypothetical protein